MTFLTFFIIIWATHVNCLIEFCETIFCIKSFTVIFRTMLFISGRLHARLYSPISSPHAPTRGPLRGTDPHVTGTVGPCKYPDTNGIVLIFIGGTGPTGYKTIKNLLRDVTFNKGMQDFFGLTRIFSTDSVSYHFSWTIQVIPFFPYVCINRKVIKISQRLIHG